MDRKIKLIWDFRGPDAKAIAKHHTVHLKEFTLMKDLPFHEINIQEINPMFFTAFITIDETKLAIFRDALKPHRGELA